LFLHEPIQDGDTYLTTWHTLYKKFPFIDSSCKDAGRYWFKSQDIISINHHGDLITPSIPEKPKVSNIPFLSNGDKGILARSTTKIVNDGIYEEGSRNISIFKAAVDCRQQGYSFDETMAMLSGKSTLSSVEEFRNYRIRME
jgi:hypothetical protein